MDDKQKMYLRFGMQIVSTICLVMALMGMMWQNQIMISSGIALAGLINGASSFMQYRATHKFSQLILSVMLIGLGLFFLASLFV